MAVKAWERREDESVKAYEAFSAYRDLGINRTLEVAWKQYSKGDKTVPGYFKQWSSTYDWVSRCNAYDDYIDAGARKKLDREAIRRKADMLKRHAGIGKALQSFGLQHVQTTKQPAKAADAINAIAKGIEIERKSEGLPEYLLQVMETPDDELARQYNELVASIGGTGSGDETAGTTDTGSNTAEETASE